MTKLPGLRGRHLDEHQPAECRNVGMCDRTGTPRLVASSALSPGIFSGFDPGSCFMSAAQHGRDVAIGDQLALGDDDVSVTFPHLP